MRSYKAFGLISAGFLLMVGAQLACGATGNNTPPDQQVVVVPYGASTAPAQSEQPASEVSPAPNAIVFQNPQSYRVTYISTVHNQALDLSELQVYQPRPIEWDAQQDVRIESISPEITSEGTDPDYHNGIYFWSRQSEPAPGSSLEFKIVFTLTAYETNTHIDPLQVQPYRQEDPEYQLYTRSERYIEVNNPQIMALAEQIGGGETNPYLLAEKFYDYIIDNTRYVLLGEGLKGAEHVSSTGSGECGDYASLFIALARASGIPARPVVGYWAISGIDQTHVWAEFYVEPFGWVPVDPTIGQSEPSMRDYYFGNMDNQRVILNKGFNIVLVPPAPDDFKAPFLQVPLWWYWHTGGDESGTYIERTTWSVETLP